MSHLSKVKMAMKDLEALKEAAKQLGMVFDTSIHELRTSFIHVNKCLGVLKRQGERHPNNMAAVVQGEGGEYELQLDYYCNSLSSVLGSDGMNLTKKYAEVLTESEMCNAGYVMDSKTLDNKTGETVLVFHQM